MTSSAPYAAEPWPEPLVDDDLEPMTAAPESYDLVDQVGYHTVDDSFTTGLEDDVREEPYDTAALGLPARGLIVGASAATAAYVVLDLILTGGRLTFFFDLCFVVTCLVAAMAVRRSDLFTAGVLPPLLYAAVIAVLSVVAPSALETAASGVIKVFLTGLADHATGLVSGYAVALAAVTARNASAVGRR
jgi:hypothetical protein